MPIQVMTAVSLVAYGIKEFEKKKKHFHTVSSCWYGDGILMVGISNISKQGRFNLSFLTRAFLSALSMFVLLFCLISLSALLRTYATHEPSAYYPKSVLSVIFVDLAYSFKLFLDSCNVVLTTTPESLQSTFFPVCVTL